MRITQNVSSLDASVITSGRLVIDRLPSGVLNSALLGQGAGVTPAYTALDAAHIQSGRFIADRLLDGTLNQILTGQGAGNSPAYAAPAGLQSKMLKHARTGADASGQVAYTGYGFTPKALIINAIKGGAATTASISWGFVDSGLLEFVIYYPTSVTWAYYEGFVIRVGDPGVNEQYAQLSSFDADGFTLNWTKVGAGSPNFDFGVLALR